MVPRLSLPSWRWIGPLRADRLGPEEYRFSVWLFLRLLALVYLIAFVSLWVQLDGLIGSDGILPAAERLEMLEQRLEHPLQARPTLCWISTSDLFLHGLCAVGSVVAVLLLVGLWPLPALLLLWICYLSLFNVGGIFLSFQWDTLLLETGALALFVAPPQLLPRLPRSQRRAPWKGGVWLLRLLLFKLMVLSGVVKLLVLDETWWGLTALDYHYYTQPLPAWTSWYAHHLPDWFQKASVLSMFVIEIGVPFLIFFGRRLRALAAGSIASLMLLIGLTGNYNFFNLLTLALCVPLLDDGILLACVPRRLQTPLRGTAPWDLSVRGEGVALRMIGWIVRSALALGLVGLSATSFVAELVRTQPPDGLHPATKSVLDWGERSVLGWGEPLLRELNGFHLANGFGLFRGMTTRRPEILLEVSRDGRIWEALEFRWKPGDPSRRPRFVQPHQPRLDWQMWFAALNVRRHGYWLERLAQRVLAGSPAVYGLLAPTPYASDPPRYVRYAFYVYEFTSPEQRAASAAWWTRQRVGQSGVISQRSPE